VMKLAEIAQRIDAHLRRFEHDKSINKDISKEGTGLHLYYDAGAGASGRFVHVTYVRYREPNHLTREQATAYLDWLDAGNIGTHYGVKT
jgi:hypothetical protein